MPCFKGLAVSIHVPDGPLPEHSIQRQSRQNRITSYIPVPPARIPEDSATNKPEQSTFAISITLLVPGQEVPYSEPKATDHDPFPEPKRVGALPTTGEERGRYGSVITSYSPLTASANETIAAYIYFDGRAKEEVATLLRRGEETWVNSRWVSVPQSEGGGLAEREFLFREVGLERWLNGLDLDGKEAAAKIERRRQRMEKRELRRTAGRSNVESAGSIATDAVGLRRGLRHHRETSLASLDAPFDDFDATFSSGSDSDDEDPVPEAAGQIKVALFRVLASGEIKRGEYSPQFDAHDDDDDGTEAGPESAAAAGKAAAGDEADVDHTTSFAKPKTLDPNLISTQTVTGIDGPEKPYAVFTFLYRGEKQLQKMGILPTLALPDKATPTAAKRKSQQTDFSKLGPLKTGGTVGFSAFRDQGLKPNQTGKARPRGRSTADSDEDEDEDDKNDLSGKLDDIDPKLEDKNLLSPDDAVRQGELADGLRKIKLKRAHSVEPAGDASTRRSPSTNSPPTGHSPADQIDPSLTPPPSRGFLSNNLAPTAGPDAVIGSPLKRSRQSLPGTEDESLRNRLGLGLSPGIGDVLGRIDRAPLAEGRPLSSDPIGHEKKHQEDVKKDSMEEDEL